MEGKGLEMSTDSSKDSGLGEAIQANGVRRGQHGNIPL